MSTETFRQQTCNKLQCAKATVCECAKNLLFQNTKDQRAVPIAAPPTHYPNNTAQRCLLIAASGALTIALAKIFICATRTHTIKTRTNCMKRPAIKGRQKHTVYAGATPTTSATKRRVAAKPLCHIFVVPRYILSIYGARVCLATRHTHLDVAAADFCVTTVYVSVPRKARACVRLC